MNKPTNHTKHIIVNTIWITTLLGMTSVTWAEDYDKADILFF